MFFMKAESYVKCRLSQRWLNLLILAMLIYKGFISTNWNGSIYYEWQ